jgi:hypothetical protein
LIFRSFGPFFGLGNQIKEGDYFGFRVFEDPLLFFHAEMGVYVFIYGQGFKPAVLDFPAGGVLGCFSAVKKRYTVAEHSAVVFFIVVLVHGVMLWVDVVDQVDFVDRGQNGQIIFSGADGFSSTPSTVHVVHWVHVPFILFQKNHHFPLFFTKALG